jgi:hypothetical protein
MQKPVLVLLQMNYEHITLEMHAVLICYVLHTVICNIIERRSCIDVKGIHRLIKTRAVQNQISHVTHTKLTLNTEGKLKVFKNAKNILM